MKKSLVLMGIVALLFIVPCWIFLAADSGSTEPETENLVVQETPKPSSDPPTEWAMAVVEPVSIGQDSDSDMVAQVGDVTITRAQMSDIQYGRDSQSRLETLIQRAFLILEFHRRGVELPEAAVQERVNDVILKEFRGNQVAFAERLKAQGYTLEEFRESEADKIRVIAARALLWRENDVNDRSMREREEAISKWVKEMQQQIPVVYANKSPNR